MFSSYFFTGNPEVRVSCLKLKTMIEFQEEMGWGRAKLHLSFFLQLLQHSFVTD